MNEFDRLRLRFAGILVYTTKALKMAAFGENDPGDVPMHTDVKLGGRPSCMAVSRDNLRVAVALEDKVRCSERQAFPKESFLRTRSHA